MERIIITPDKVGEIIKELRVDNEITQEELANRVSMTRQSIIGIEKGNQLPPIPTLSAILETLGYNLHLKITKKKKRSSSK